MKKKFKFIKIAALVATLSLAKFAVAAPENQTSATQPQVIKHITVVNNSTVDLLPTVEGVDRGCIGGSMPQLITRNTTREVDILFIQYLLTCRFNVLPLPNIVTILQGCRQVKDKDTVTFTGTDIASLQCKVN